MKRLLCLLLAFCLTFTAAAFADQEADAQPQEEIAAEGAALLTPRERLGLEAEASPAWVTALAEKYGAEQLFVIAAYGSASTAAWISMHEQDAGGEWKMILTTPGYIGRNGLGKTKEGDGMTPVGVFSFNRAFGIAADPGCAIPYVRADEDTYWSGDAAYHYNEMVRLSDYPALNREDSEHIVDYIYEYQYCLNISYNAEGTAGRGSAIFLHCLGNRKPYTGGCVAIPMEQMYFVMRHVSPECVVVIDTLENLGGSF